MDKALRGRIYQNQEVGDELIRVSCLVMKELIWKVDNGRWGQDTILVSGTKGSLSLRVLFAPLGKPLLHILAASLEPCMS